MCERGRSVQAILLNELARENVADASMRRIPRAPIYALHSSQRERPEVTENFWKCEGEYAVRILVSIHTTNIERACLLERGEEEGPSRTEQLVRDGVVKGVTRRCSSAVSRLYGQVRQGKSGSVDAVASR